MTEEYPAEGFNLEMPSNAEMQLTGWLATARFASHGKRYAVRFKNLRAPECEREGAATTWEALPATARQRAHKAADWIGDVYRKALNP